MNHQTKQRRAVREHLDQMGRIFTLQSQFRLIAEHQKQEKVRENKGCLGVLRRMKRRISQVLHRGGSK